MNFVFGNFEFIANVKFLTEVLSVDLLENSAVTDLSTWRAGEVPGSVAQPAHLTV